MDDLRQRLARFDRPGTPRPEVAPPDREPLRRLLDAGARWHGVAPSGYLKVERDLGNPVPRTCIDSIADDLGPDVIVLDTETTGLESGTGTLVFVVGLVRWSASGLRLTQLFLPEPAGERAFLQAVADELSPVGGLLSYNGRGFDVPRLRSRMRLHRIDESGLDLPHLDLLHLTRRVVRGWLPDARLKTVEDHFLGRPRHGDLPGEFAPEVYRTLQLEARDAGLVEVLSHNALDVENLPRLAARLAGVVGVGDFDGLPAVCALGVARLRLDRGDPALAERALSRAIEEGDLTVRTEARALLAHTRRRSGDYAGAAACWEQVLVERSGDLPARVELAKLLEHRLGDRERALALVGEARTLLSLRPVVDPALSEELNHRYRRLVRKTGRGA
jgi:uncharacterized protein YprB with RNaseH-like and TPR domain